MNSTMQGNRTMFADLRARTLSSSAHDLNNNGPNNNPNWQMPPQSFGPPFDCMPNQPNPYHVIYQFTIHLNLIAILCVLKINMDLFRLKNQQNFSFLFIESRATGAMHEL